MTKRLLFCLVLGTISTILASEEPLQPFLDSLLNKEEVSTELDVQTKPITQIEQSKKPVVVEHIKIDIPYTEHPLIDKYRKEYLTDFGRKKLSVIMERASHYRIHISETLEAFDVPICIGYLPVIESDFLTTALSKSGARGLWQFMENSIAGLLKKDEWVDERLDPWLSTQAAAEKLAYNYSILKDWELALAAYNMGLNGLQTVIKNAGNSNFWYLADNGFLKDQTKNYVPKFIAIADILTNAEYYGFDVEHLDSNNEYNFTEITVVNQINLKSLSHKLGIDYATMEKLNPALLTDFSPPYPYTIRLPIGYEKEALEEIKKQHPTKTYTVKQGDTLWGIAKNNGTSVSELCNLNNIDENDILGIGTILFLPIIK